MSPPPSRAAALLALALATLSCHAASEAPRSGARAAVPAAAPATPRSEGELARDLRTHIAARAQGLTEAETRRVAETIVREARAHRVDPRLVVAVIEVESRFDPFAASEAGALGLMQILPSTGRALARRYGVSWEGPRTLFDPSLNVKLGIAYLGELRARFDHLPTALAAYNWGPSAIRRRMREGVELPLRYARRVLAVYRRSVPAETATS